MRTGFDRRAEVLVWGGGSGGVAAALQAARSGARTLLLTPGPWLGGMVSAAGVCAPDGNELSPWQSGLWGALLRALQRSEPEGLDQNWVSCFGYRPASAERILRRWVAAEARLEWWAGARLGPIERDGDRISAVSVGHGGLQQRLLPTIVIDGSDRGDLFPLAGAPFRFGWEAKELWQEPSAPTAERLRREPFFQQQPVQSPTWVCLGQLDERGGPAAPAGDAWRHSPPCLDAPFARATEAFGLERTLTYGRLPGGLVMLNWPLHGNDWHHGLERAFAEQVAGGAADAEAAEGELLAAMRDHSEAFAAALRQASGGWLGPAAVFPSQEEAMAGRLDGGESLALMPYWREGRRLVARELVLEQHLLPQASGACIAPLSRDADGALSSIAVGNYANDHHYPGGDWPLAPKSCRWGGRWSGTPFTIPYGALVSDGVTNLLAADKGFGVSHMANGATRLQPLVLNIGQAAGLAAALCVRHGLEPAALPVRRLQEALISDLVAPAGVLPLWDTPWHHPLWRERQRQALEAPERLDRHGQLEASAELAAPAGWAPPPEPGERLWRGELVPDGQGGYVLHGETGAWPLIALEPALHHWLLSLDRPTPVALIGCANPWGPWLRVSRLVP
ncbi:MULTISPECIES: FAD-dependent oxidoreductase [unclassified Cyanobium]|uniref:FAD-dependent oxidoreductase n=1 Tax=unclassified Cyanobium TaxID=2627006 RepID=UPI0020CE4021|nr:MULTISPECIES: FAD-dependent oxidoreductase [unclassified Cyanobium]MCP9833144.1 FAD-dependent oxidoreductase [Cyanobium sp. La Preciosa 7G6]MCP9935993.1 FAD-dependent oxidoreductase [Cyanobium sp. Aljojuca 7A6]